MLETNSSTQNNQIIFAHRYIFLMLGRYFYCRASQALFANIGYQDIANVRRIAMSSPQIRRADRAMSDQRTLETLARGYSGRLATVSEDGFPYCIPLLYLWINGEIYVHTASARGHFRANIERDPRVCFELDEQEGVFDYGRFECDSGLAYQSVCVFGRIRIVEDTEVKQRFCEALMEKYGKPNTKRPRGFFPRIDVITVYAIRIERMTGKECPLPPLSEQWPAKDRTKTPNALLPKEGRQ